jgi:enoyl-[acyl-carrier-protein] reductase (NADH)
LRKADVAQGHDPMLAGNKALVVSIANEHSIAYDCAKAFRYAEHGATQSAKIDRASQSDNTLLT